MMHSLRDLASLYTVSVLHQIIAEKFGKVIGGGTFVGLKYREKMKKTNVTKIDASYVAPTVYVVEIKSEGCLCGSFDRTESNDPDDYEYGGRL